MNKNRKTKALKALSLEDLKEVQTEYGNAGADVSRELQEMDITVSSDGETTAVRQKIKYQPPTR